MIEKIPLLFWPHANTLTTLIFHRVMPLYDPLRPGEPDARRFDRIARFLGANFTVLHLSDAVDRLVRGNLPRRACCITFDDGYADNLTIAQPILKKYNLPATVFVATGYLDGGRMFNDAVIDGIARSPLKALDLSPLGLGKLDISSNENQRKALSYILQSLKYRPPLQRTENIDTFLRIAECGTLPDNIMLTTEQLAELARQDVEIGGHTVNHPILASIDDDSALEEIAAGKQHLESVIGKPLTSFAYPNGKPLQDYTLLHVGMVRELGFALAVSTSPGVCRSESDLFQLPRFTPWDQSRFMYSFRMATNAILGKAEIC